MNLPQIAVMADTTGSVNKTSYRVWSNQLKYIYILLANVLDVVNLWLSKDCPLKKKQLLPTYQFYTY